MGYPEGGSVLFNDALPLASLPTKLVYQVTGLKVNPFGWWMLAALCAPGRDGGARACRRSGSDPCSLPSWPAVLAVVSTAFLTRMGHSALASHFLILWALALHFERDARASRRKPSQATVLLAVTLHDQRLPVRDRVRPGSRPRGARCCFAAPSRARDLLGAVAGLAASCSPSDWLPATVSCSPTRRR